MGKALTKDAEVRTEATWTGWSSVFINWNKCMTPSPRRTVPKFQDLSSNSRLAQAGVEAPSPALPPGPPIMPLPPDAEPALIPPGGGPPAPPIVPIPPIIPPGPEKPTPAPRGIEEPTGPRDEPRALLDAPGKPIPAPPSLAPGTAPPAR